MKRTEQVDLSVYDDFLELNFSGKFEGFPSLNRRDFLQFLGAGILVFVTSRSSSAQGWGRQLPDDFNAFLRIGEDGKVTGFTGKIEMGQGINTSLAQMLAEELDVSVEDVEMVMGDTDLCPWDMGTFGSMTTRFFGPPLREAAAEAKAVLIELASQKLNIPTSKLQTEDGTVFSPGTDSSVTYAELAKGQKILRQIETEAALEEASEFTIVGKPLLRVDARAKVTGEAEYTGDIEVPGKLHASILRPPAHGAQLKKIDTTPASKIEGLQIIQDGDLVAAIHERPDLAMRAIEEVEAEFETKNTGLDDENIFKHLLKSVPAGETVAEGGDLQQGRDASSSVSEMEYLNSYVAHATIEPHTAIARLDGDQLTVWASTQTPFRLKEEAASELGIPPEKVRVITPYVGGGFGGKSQNQQALEAVRLAKLTGKPIQVMWSRKEEFFLDTFRPAGVVKINAGTNDSGRIEFWDYGVYAAGERGSQQFYDIPNHRTVVYGSGWRGSSGTHPFPTGAWRAPANNTNTFARESHVDVLAAQCEMDPVEFRLKNLRDKKMIRVLETVAEKYGWSSGKSPSGHGAGVSLAIDAGTYVAHIAEIEVDKASGQIQVKRIVCAQDMGRCINPAGAELQMEGCITMGLGYALTEEIRFKEGEILDSNFDTYEIPRFSWVPEIETIILDRPHDPPQGGGEPAIVSMGSVLANALFDATGARLLQLPMIPKRVKTAIEKV